jgi:hypothetical protein
VGDDGDVAKFHGWALLADVRGEARRALLLNAKMTGIRRRAVWYGG